MDWGSILGIIGIIATIVFGLWGVYLVIRRQRYPGELAFFVEPSIRLFDDITKNIPLLTVSYKGQPVPKNLTITRGYLVNTGSKDITREMVDQPLQLQLKQGYRWLEASGKATLDEKEHAKIIDDQTVEFSLGLFRRDEFIRFEGLIEVGEGKHWIGQFQFRHRIADTSNVKYQPIQFIRKPVSGWKMLFGCLFLGLFGIAYGAGLITSGLYETHSLMFVVGGVLLITFVISILLLAFATSRYYKRIRRLLKLDTERANA